MKKMVELQKREAQTINGGGSAWNWTGKVIGSIIGFLGDVGDAYTSTPEGQAVQQALIDFQ